VFLNLAVECAIRKVKENKGFEPNETCQFDVYADDINLLGENMHTIKAKVLLEAVMEVV
jgi:hypothetical protein